MKGTSRMTRYSAFVGVVVASAAGVVGFASPAMAADLGTLTINPTTGGSVTTSPMFTSATTSVACPTGYGTNAALKVGPVGGPYNNLVPIGALGTYANGPFSLSPNRSLSTAMGGSVPDGQYEMVVICVSDVLGDNPDKFRSAPFSVSGGNWAFPPVVVAANTTTTLTASPAATAPYHTDVTMTAHVTASPAAAIHGSVNFRSGATVIGSAPVNAAGDAVLVNATLPVGPTQLSAVFAPSDNLTNGSTSSNVPFEITAPAGGDSKTENINAEVAPGNLTLAVPATAVTLTGGVVGGHATGNMNPATVTDLRGNGQAWNLTGQVSNFVSGANTIDANQLGWTPAAHNVNSEAGTVVAGPVAAPVTAGLGTARTLCSAAAGANAGVFECTAGLDLQIPQSARPGAYAATLTLTLI